MVPLPVFCVPIQPGQVCRYLECIHLASVGLCRTALYIGGTLPSIRVVASESTSRVAECQNTPGQTTAEILASLCRHYIESLVCILVEL